MNPVSDKNHTCLVSNCTGAGHFGRALSTMYTGHWSLPLTLSNFDLDEEQTHGHLSCCRQHCCPVLRSPQKQTTKNCPFLRCHYPDKCQMCKARRARGKWTQDEGPGFSLKRAQALISPLPSTLSVRQRTKKSPGIFLE